MLSVIGMLPSTGLLQEMSEKNLETGGLVTTWSAQYKQLTNSYCVCMYAFMCVCMLVVCNSGDISIYRDMI